MRLPSRDREPPPTPAAASVPVPQPGPLALGRRPRRRLGWAGATSALLHALFALAILLEIDPRARRPQELPPPSFAVVFEGGSDQAPQAAEAPDLAPAVTAEAPPTPSAPPPPPPPPVTTTVPPPPPSPPVAPPSQLAAAPPPPPLPQPAPAAPPPLPSPAETPPSRPTEAAPPPPAPPPPVPAQPAPPAPSPPVIAALPLPPPSPPPAPQRQPPLDLTDRPPIRLGEADPSRPGAPRRGLDLRPGATLPGPGEVENLRVRGAEAGPDWRNAFRMWLDRNLRYPREAADLGEQGPVTVRITTGADGRVRSVELRSGSRSIFLNHYSQAVFRGAALPPFPPGTAEEQVTIDLTINYILYRR